MGRRGTWEHVCLTAGIESLLLVERKRVKEERNNTVQCIAKSDEQLRHNLCSVSNVDITKLRNCWKCTVTGAPELGYLYVKSNTKPWEIRWECNVSAVKE